MASFFDKISGKARKKKIDNILKQSQAPQQLPAKKAPAPKPRDERSGGLGDDFMTNMLNKLKAEQDKKAKIKRRD